jgi:uncharacterized protein (TIGR02391 family)
MATIPRLNETHLHAICSILGDTNEGLTGTQIGQLLQRCGIDDPSPGITKRDRLFDALRAKQERDGCANNILAFVETALDPVRFIGNAAGFATFRDRLNEALAFSGLHLGEDGKLQAVAPARTLDEAQERAGRLRSELARRRVHHDVLQFCKAELLKNNYFHAVFEATKSVAEKIRQRTGLTSDGAELVDEAFGLKSPLLAINTLRTETEQTEQKGFANLVKGVFGVFRNVTAHAPKITWPIDEQDALDLLSLVSYVHRRLDTAADVPRTKTPSP